MDMLDQDVTISEIRNSLMNIYDVDEPTCTASIHSFLQQMDQNGFIEFHN